MGMSRRSARPATTAECPPFAPATFHLPAVPMFKNAAVYRIHQWKQPDLADLESRLDGARFIECGAAQQESAGWVEPRGEAHGPLVEAVGNHWVLKLCVERKGVPGSAVKSRLEERLDQIERETGRRPKGKHAKELKEEVVQDLLPRAFPKRSHTWVWIDPKAGLIVVDAGSNKRAEGVATRLVELLEGALQLSLLQVNVAPATAMAAWLTDHVPPAGFTLDRECELKQPEGEKATVRYARHTLEIDEIAAHITQGKVPTQVAMTWRDRVSFVLTEGLTLKKIKLLDVVLEGKSPEGSRDDNGFDADVAITTGELAPLITDLVDALDGEMARDGVAAAPQGAPELKAA